MTQDEIVKEFYGYLKEYEREPQVRSLKIQLGDEYNDAIQDTLISLIKYNENNEIDPTKIKGMMFIAHKRKCLNVLLRKKNKYQNVDIDEKYDLTEEWLDDRLESEHHQMLRERILEHITPAEYLLLLEYYKNIYEDEYDKALTAKVGYIKAKMGYKKYYILIEPDGSEITFKYLNQISTHIGCNYVYLTTAMKSGSFSYQGKSYKIKTIGTINEIPKRRNKKK